MNHYETKSTLPVGKSQIQKATELLREYKSCKTNLEKRIIENNQWWKLQHWSLIGSANPGDPQPTSAWLFNCIANKHADAMDNYPEPFVLPRRRQCCDMASSLSKVLPVILEYNDFEQVYSDVWWYKLKTGTGCYGVFWNNSLEEGMGDIDIRQIDILNMFWESGIRDIQESRNVFNVELESNDVLEERYPILHGKLSSPSVDVASYIYDDTVKTDDKSAVVDWYYKKYHNGREIVHFCKFVGDTVLYASENIPELRERGFYDHGKYPFVFDVLFIDEGTPCGFGYVDIMKNVQMYIDKLNQIILKNALQSGRRRFFISDNAGINEEEFADWTKEFVHTAGSLDERNIREINVSQLDGSIIGLLNQKIDELKETSGNRDISQGGASHGITAASAIASLQEAGSKLSRDMIKSSYRAFRKINYLIIDLIKQFYNENRSFRTAEGDPDNLFTDISNHIFDNLCSQCETHSVTDTLFDISVTAQKANPFSVSAQNELAKELYSMGMFKPELAHQALICLEMMNFEGKNKIAEKIKESASAFPPPTDESAAPPHISSDEESLVRGYRNAMPGIQTVKEASRSVNP